MESIFRHFDNGQNFASQLCFSSDLFFLIVLIFIFWQVILSSHVLELSLDGFPHACQYLACVSFLS